MPGALPKYILNGLNSCGIDFIPRKYKGRLIFIVLGI